MTALEEVVVAIDKHTNNLPVIDETRFTKTNIIFFCLLYLGLWIAVVWYTYHKQFVKQYLVGFIAGVIIFSIEVALKTLSGTVYVDAISGRSYYYDTVAGVDQSAAYEVMLENDYLTAENVNTAYILPTEQFQKLKSEKKVDSIPLREYYNTDFNKDLGNTRQSDPIFFSQKSNDISNTLFYVAILVLTLAIYINDTAYKTPYHLVWVLASVIVSVIGMALSIGDKSQEQLNLLLFMKERLLIVSFSFAITSILVSWTM